MLSAKRDGKAAERFLRKVLRARHTQNPRVVNVVQNAAYPVAADAMNEDETIELKVELRQVKYLNNMIEQDHRNIKRIVKPMMGFKFFNSTRRTLQGIEAMSIMRKGQVSEINQGDSVSQAKFIEELFGVIA
jgi:transposase-like protein